LKIKLQLLNKMAEFKKKFVKKEGYLNIYLIIIIFLPIKKRKYKNYNPELKK